MPPAPPFPPSLAVPEKPPAAVAAFPPVPPIARTITAPWRVDRLPPISRPSTVAAAVPPIPPSPPGPEETKALPVPNPALPPLPPFAPTSTEIASAGTCFVTAVLATSVARPPPAPMPPPRPVAFPTSFEMAFPPFPPLPPFALARSEAPWTVSSTAPPKVSVAALAAPPLPAKPPFTSGASPFLCTVAPLPPCPPSLMDATPPECVCVGVPVGDSEVWVLIPADWPAPALGFPWGSPEHPTAPLLRSTTAVSGVLLMILSAGGFGDGCRHCVTCCAATESDVKAKADTLNNSVAKTLLHRVAALNVQFI